MNRTPRLDRGFVARCSLALAWLFCFVNVHSAENAPVAASGSSPGAANQPSQQTDSQREAQSLFDRMTRHLASLTSFSVEFRDGYDVVQSNGQKIEFGETRRVTLARPDRLRVEEVASDGQHDVAMFDGKTISVLDADEGVYAQAAQPGGVDEALVYYVRSLRMRMPLALLLTRNLPDVLGGRVKSIDYVERTDILGVPTHHIAGRGETVDFQFWIRDGEQPLPVRVVITYARAEGQPQFWANFSGWNLKPAISATTFAFSPPKDAKKIPFAIQVRGSPPPEPPSGKESRP
jgi:hypothetical protein